jgi:hypothetical protein
MPFKLRFSNNYCDIEAFPEATKVIFSIYGKIYRKIPEKYLPELIIAGSS